MPLSRREFDRRVAAGARTLEEIDPVFWAWYMDRQREHLFMAVGLSIAAVLFVAIAIAMVVL
jgi:hypothetical protein